MSVCNSNYKPETEAAALKAGRTVLNVCEA